MVMMMMMMMKNTNQISWCKTTQHPTVHLDDPPNDANDHGIRQPQKWGG